MATNDSYSDEKYGLAGVRLTTKDGTAVQLSAEDEGRAQRFAGSYVGLYPKDDSTPFAFAAPAEGGVIIQYRDSGGVMRHLDAAKAFEALAKLVEGESESKSSCCGCRE